MATVLPPAYEDADIDYLVQMIGDMLERLLKHNDQIPFSADTLTRFHSRSPPNISVIDYLRRIVKYTNLEKSCLLITLHYIDQMCARLPRFAISSLTVHRFLITSVAVSTKALCDAFCTNNHYAKIGGIKVAELNVLEREFLHALDWRLTCDYEHLQAYYINLARSSSTFEVPEVAESTVEQSSEVPAGDIPTPSSTSDKADDSSYGGGDSSDENDDTHEDNDEFDVGVVRASPHPGDIHIDAPASALLEESPAVGPAMTPRLLKRVGSPTASPTLPQRRRVDGL